VPCGERYGHRDEHVEPGDGHTVAERGEPRLHVRVRPGGERALDERRGQGHDAEDERGDWKDGGAPRHAHVADAGVIREFRTQSAEF
jgi:hypothetical protein